MALSPGLPGWASTRKVKPIWILLKQETVSGVGISWAICTSAPRSRQITTPAPHHSVFYRPDALPATQPTASKHWRHHSTVPSRIIPWLRNGNHPIIDGVLFRWTTFYKAPYYDGMPKCHQTRNLLGLPYMLCQKLSNTKWVTPTPLWPSQYLKTQYQNVDQLLQAIITD